MKNKKQRLWETSLDLYAAAASAGAEAWAQSKAEAERLKSEIKKLRWDNDLLTRACEGLRQSRQHIIADNNRLKEENHSLKAENQKLNELLDMISASKNQELVAELYEKRGA